MHVPFIAIAVMCISKPGPRADALVAVDVTLGSAS